MFPGSLAGCCLELWGSCDPRLRGVGGGVRRRIGPLLSSSPINCVAECYNHLVMGGMQKAQSVTHARVKSAHCIGTT
jgi:hypothetical protein